ncbi:MAG: KR domain-containing protein, partial [Tatlockia sp.]|nr:KR domain-containing protein [Tatlockia sp.]
MNAEQQAWKQEGPRFAGVSSFGIGGTNAHVVLAEAESLAEPTLEGSALLIFSAKTMHDLKEILAAYGDYCGKNPATSIYSLARTLQEGRAEFNYRAAMVVSSLADLKAGIDSSEYSFAHCELVLDRFIPKPIEQCTPSDLSELKEKWLQGHVIGWSDHYQLVRPRKLHLPVYPFSRRSYWIDAYKANVGDEHKRLSMDKWFYLPGWRKSIFSDANCSINSVLLVFLTAESFKPEWLDALLPRKQVIIVAEGNEFIHQSNDSFIMDFARPEHYVDLLCILKGQNCLPTHLLHTLTHTPNWEETSRELFDREQSHGLLSIIHFVQAWEKNGIDCPLKLTVLTNRLNQVANECLLEPHKAPLLAAVKVIPKELIAIQSQLVDWDLIDRPQFKAYQLQQLKQELFKPHYDQEEIVYRAGQRWLRDYISVPIPTPAIHHAAKGCGKVLLITGGLGQLGLDIADYFSQVKGYKIALLARSKIPPEAEWEEIIKGQQPLCAKLERIISMRKRGALVLPFSADVGEEASLISAIHDIENRMGRITGVIHAAGDTVNGIISLKTENSLQESYQSKVFGTYNLHKAFKDHHLSFFILCSSMNAIIGGLGQLDNTAANSFIDYMAEFMASQSGQNVFAINWGAVNLDRPMKVNVLHQFEDLSIEHKKNNMTDEESNQIYDRLLSVHPGPRLVISTIDMQTVLKNWNRVASIEELAKDRVSYQKEKQPVLA